MFGESAETIGLNTDRLFIGLFPELFFPTSSLVSFLVTFWCQRAQPLPETLFLGAELVSVNLQPSTSARGNTERLSEALVVVGV